MALVQYTIDLFYPAGGVAANRAVSVTLLGSNVVPPMFTDRAGTTSFEPVTDVDGRLSFFAAPGLYAASFAGEAFIISVDEGETEEVIPDLFVHEQTDPATVWTVDHKFGVEPVVSVLVNKSEETPEITHPDKMTTVLTFQVSTSGTANLRR